MDEKAGGYTSSLSDDGSDNDDNNNNVERCRDDSGGSREDVRFISSDHKTPRTEQRPSASAKKRMDDTVQRITASRNVQRPRCTGEKQGRGGGAGLVTGSGRKRAATDRTRQSGWNDGCRAARLGDESSPTDRRERLSGDEWNASEVVNRDELNGEVVVSSRRQQLQSSRKHDSQSGWSAGSGARLEDESQSDDGLLLNPDYELDGEMMSDRHQLQSRKHPSQSGGRSAADVCHVVESPDSELWRAGQSGAGKSNSVDGVRRVESLCKEPPPPPQFMFRTSSKASMQLHRQQRGYSSQVHADLTGKTSACKSRCPSGFLSLSTASTNDREVPPKPGRDSRWEYHSRNCEHADPCDFIHRSSGKDFDAFDRRLAAQDSCRDLAQNSIACSSIHSRGAEVSKPDSLQQRWTYTDPCHFIRPSSKDYFGSRGRLPQDSCRDLAAHAFSSIPCSRDAEVRAEASSMLGLPLTSKMASNNNLSSGGSLALQRQHSSRSGQQRSALTVVAHDVTSTTDRPCEAFNKPDVTDRSPANDHHLAVHSRHPSSTTDRPARSFVSADVLDSSSRQSSTVDRPARAFNSADLADSLSAGHDYSRNPSGTISTAAAPPGRHLDHADDIMHSLGSPGHDDFRCPSADITTGHVDVGSGPSVVSGRRQWRHFYVDCADCPRCLGTYALCGACNAFHEPLLQPQHSADDDDCQSLPTATDLCQPADFLTDSFARGRHSPLRRNTGTVDDGEFPEDRRLTVRNIMMDLHDASVDREPAVARAAVDGGAGGPAEPLLSSEAPVGLRGPCSNDREQQSVASSRTRLRSLHFYTDCSDCPDCCSTSVCGSCCSVHGPAQETPGDLSPRCTKPQSHRRPIRDDSWPQAESRDPCLPADQRLPACGDAKTPACTSTADTRDHCKPRDSSATDKPSCTDKRTSTSSDSAELLAMSSADASNRAADKTAHSTTSYEECWTIVEKATCGVLGLLIFVIFVAIYLQLSRRYFTGVGTLGI